MATVKKVKKAQLGSFIGKAIRSGAKNLVKGAEEKTMTLAEQKAKRDLQRSIKNRTSGISKLEDEFDIPVSRGTGRRKGVENIPTGGRRALNLKNGGKKIKKAQLGSSVKKSNEFAKSISSSIKKGASSFSTPDSVKRKSGYVKSSTKMKSGGKMSKTSKKH